MKVRTMLVLGLVPTCARCDRAFQATPDSPFYCPACPAAAGSVEELYRQCMGDAARAFPRFRLVLSGNPPPDVGGHSLKQKAAKEAKNLNPWNP